VKVVRQDERVNVDAARAADVRVPHEISLHELASERRLGKGITRPDRSNLDKLTHERSVKQKRHHEHRAAFSRVARDAGRRASSRAPPRVFFRAPQRLGASRAARHRASRVVYRLREAAHPTKGDAEE
jgi:hypothetical protein